MTDPKTREMPSLIGRTSDSMIAMIRNTLDFSRGINQEVEKSWFHMQDLNDGIVDRIVRDGAEAILETMQRPAGELDCRHGYGVGLSLEKSIVERHGGSIRLDTTCGDGARFITALPATS